MPEPENPLAVWQALSHLLDAQGDRLYAMLARLTLRQDVAAELFQDLFVRLARNKALSEANDPTAYAFRSAINLAMEWRRKRQTDVKPMSLVAAMDIASAQQSPLQRMALSEQYEQLLDALSELDESARRLFVLRFIEEQSYELIANEVETTPHRARGLCHAALRKLRRKLSERTMSRNAICPGKNHV